MANMKEISNEALTAALLQNGTIKATAEALGITPRTIYNRFQEQDFLICYSEVKNDILRNAVHNINSKLSQALDTVAEIMTDKSINAAVRLQAAQTIINSAEKFTTRLADDERAARVQASPLWTGVY